MSHFTTISRKKDFREKSLVFFKANLNFCCYFPMPLKFSLESHCKQFVQTSSDQKQPINLKFHISLAPRQIEDFREKTLLFY